MKKIIFTAIAASMIASPVMAGGNRPAPSNPISIGDQIRCIIFPAYCPIP